MNLTLQRRLIRSSQRPILVRGNHTKCIAGHLSVARIGTALASTQNRGIKDDNFKDCMDGSSKNCLGPNKT